MPRYKFRVEQQHEELLARHRLELCKRKARHSSQASDAPQRIHSALINAAQSEAHVNEAAKGALKQAAFPDAGLDLIDAVLNEFAVKGRLRRRAMRLQILRIDACGGLKCGRSVDGKEEVLHEAVADLAPAFQRIDDLL